MFCVSGGLGVAPLRKFPIRQFPIPSSSARRVHNSFPVSPSSPSSQSCHSWARHVYLKLCVEFGRARNARCLVIAWVSSPSSFPDLARNHPSYPPHTLTPDFFSHLAPNERSLMACWSRVPHPRGLSTFRRILLPLHPAPSISSRRWRSEFRCPSFP